ncbi:hypothetical protein EV702DRAFT_1182481 [Suillus placidus]|uniref:Uncharacterized protein n=1 Tax=Suillus placidus TaxID=48579 RepID=A0A9P6ZGS9_9AGAM|nr:hypothetical protein EV702DRAFT_1182481 [Suillus placidus]
MDDNGTDHESRQHVEHQILERDRVTIVQYPDSQAGKPITHAEVWDVNATYGSSISDTENLYSPFSSQMDWEIAQWAKLHGLSSTAFSDFLSIGGVNEHLDLSYKNSRELNGIINKQLPGRPKFHHEQIIVAGEAFCIFYQDVLECIKALYGDLDFVDYLVFSPECHYTDDDETVRLYSDMHTETRRDNIPIIISTNKTQVTVFCNKTAYPIYLTIGNIPKEIHRKPYWHAHILLAYLPTTHLEHITNKASCRQSAANLYHACMACVLSPLKKAGLDGLAMCSGDGISCHCHPFFACFVGDYSKQVLATAVKTTECPKCDIPPDKLESSTAPFEIHDLHAILDTLATIDVGDLEFVQPVIHPFLERLPFANIFQAITPNILHQLYQGLVKHLLHWLAQGCGPIEIDVRCRRLPPNHHICLFMKGITGLSHVSGAEHAKIFCFILIHGLLDFLYLAQYLCHSSETLSLLDEALVLFHDNKQIFVNLDAYHATNHKDEFTQMTQWLECKEKIMHHAKFIRWRLHDNPSHHPRPLELSFDQTQTLTKHPSAKAVSFQSLVLDYGATYIHEALTRYIVQQNHLDKSLSCRRLEDLAANVLLPFCSDAVYHKIKWLSVDARGHGDPLVTVDSVHVKLCYCVGQIRAIFLIQERDAQSLFPLTNQPPRHLAYIEWFTPFPSTPDSRHGMYKITRIVCLGERVASIIPVSNIACSVHLIPKFGPVAPHHWMSNNVLEECDTFFINCYIDRHNFVTLR